MKKPISHLAQVFAAWLPVAGIGAFIALYFYAASIYPGGTRLNHQIRGYSHLSNYWCDLLDKVSYSGAINCGRHFAVIATIILPLSLIPFWLQVTLLFQNHSVWRPIVRIAGPASMLLSIFIFTSNHDLVINIASVLGFVAFMATMLGLAGMKRAALVTLAQVPAGLALANYIMWQAGLFLKAMPMIQKAAYASFFLWIIAVSCVILREVAGGSEWPEGQPSI